MFLIYYYYKFKTSGITELEIRKYRLFLGFTRSKGVGTEVVTRLQIVNSSKPNTICECGL